MTVEELENILHSLHEGKNHNSGNVVSRDFFGSFFYEGTGPRPAAFHAGMKRRPAVR
jgi:hypothetical protein